MSAQLASVTPLPRRDRAWLDDDQLSLMLVRAAHGDHHAFMEFYDATCHLVWRLEIHRYGAGELAQAAARRRYTRAWALAGDQCRSGLSVRAWLLSLPVGEAAPGQ